MNTNNAVALAIAHALASVPMPNGGLRKGTRKRHRRKKEERAFSRAVRKGDRLKPIRPMITGGKK